MRSYDSAPRPPPCPPSPVSKLVRRHTKRLRKRDNFLTGEWERGQAWSRIIRPQESLVLYKSFNSLWDITFSPPTDAISPSSYQRPNFLLLRSLRINSKEPFPPCCVAWRAGTTNQFLLGPSPHRLFKKFQHSTCSYNKQVVLPLCVSLSLAKGVGRVCVLPEPDPRGGRRGVHNRGGGRRIAAIDRTEREEQRSLL